MAINFKKKKAALVATLALGASSHSAWQAAARQGASSDKSASSDDKTITPSRQPPLPMRRS